MDNEAPLPSEYQRVECIKQTGNGSNFDTGVSGNNTNLRIKCCAEMNGFSQYRPLFGNFVNGQTNGWRVILDSKDNGRLLLSLGNKPADLLMLEIGQDVIYNNRIYFDIAYKSIFATVKNTKITDTGRTRTDGTEGNSNIAVGNSNVSSASANTQWYSNVWKIYYFRIYDNGTLIRNYLPCYRKSDNVVGMYDTVNKTFNSAIGQTPFAIG